MTHVSKVVKFEESYSPSLFRFLIAGFWPLFLSISQLFLLFTIEKELGIDVILTIESYLEDEQTKERERRIEGLKKVEVL